MINFDTESRTEPVRKDEMARNDSQVQADLNRLFRRADPNPARFKYSFLKGSIIVLEGLIGVGKSTLGKSLYHYLSSIGLEVVWFPEEIPKSLLPLYTKEMDKYAFPFQVIVARDRKAVLSCAQESIRQGKIVLIDRCLLGDYTFGLMQKEKGFFSDEEFDAYMEMISTSFNEPTFTVFLDCPPEIAFDRMKRRGHPEEIAGYSLDYFRELDQVYRRVVFSTKQYVKIDWSETDVRNDMISEGRCREFLDLLWEEHLRRI